MPKGTSPSSPPAKTVSTPSDFAAVSDNSTIIASTNTCALLISSLDMRLRITSKLACSVDTIMELVFSWKVTTGFSDDSELVKRDETVFSIAETSSALANFKYITATELSFKASLSSACKVLVILFVTKLFAERITELEVGNGTAIKLLMVGFSCNFRRSKILTASIEDKLSSLIIEI